MELLHFIDKTNFFQLKEIEKVKLLLFYNYHVNGISEFSMKDICNYLEDAGCSLPNISRLKSKMMSSKIYKFDKSKSVFTFLPIPLGLIEKEFTPYLRDYITIQSRSEFINEDIFHGYRGYLDKLITQINNTYKNNCYDACAVLIRRMFEICLILSYRNLGIDEEIKNPDGTYVMLERIVANSKNNTTLNLSRIKKEFDNIRDIGNFAAHRIEYNTSKLDLDKIQVVFRTVLEELFYKSGLKL